MKVEFRVKKFAQQCLDDKARKKAFGAERAKKVRIRLSALKAATTLEDLRLVPGRFHELTGDRAGQFATSLDGPYRLIFEPIVSEEEAELHENGWVWSKITHVSILRIEDYHG